jgi:opacity protein-like surface antigen
MNKCSILMIAFCLLPFDSNAHWYTGINLGVNAVDVKKDLVYPLNDPSPTSSSFNSTYTGFHGQLLAGYDFFLSNKLNAAIEGNADLFTGKAQQNITNWFLTNSAYAQERLEYGVAVFLLPSYQLNQTARIFIGPGVASSRFAVRSGVTAGNVGVTGSFNQWLTGGAVKAGLATKLSDNTELLLSYQYTQYNNVTWMGMETLSEESLSGRYKPSVNTFIIGVRAHVPEFTK